MQTVPSKMSWEGVINTIKSFVDCKPPKGYITPEESDALLFKLYMGQEINDDDDKPVWNSVEQEYIDKALELIENLRKLGVSPPDETTSSCLGEITMVWNCTNSGIPLKITHAETDDTFHWYFAGTIRGVFFRDTKPEDVASHVVRALEHPSDPYKRN